MQNKCNTVNSCCHNTYSCKDSKLFNQLIFEEKVDIPAAKPNVEEVISAIVEPEIVSLSVIDTPKGTSYEGQYLSGKKISIEVKLKQKIMYISKTAVQSVHVVENEVLKSLYVIVPKYIEGAPVQDLIKYKYLKPKIVIENVSAEKLNDRTIFKSIAIFIEFKLISIYSLCYSEEHMCNENYLYLAYSDGTNKKQLTCLSGCKILDIKWSPCGQKFAFICKSIYTGEKSLYIYYICNSTLKNLTEACKFKHVTSYCWSKDGQSLIFTSYSNKSKNIFSIDLNSLKCKQLTYSGAGWNSFKPKYSLNGEFIAYLKYNEDEMNLYIMKNNTLGTKKLVSAEKIKSFDWYDENSIAYVHSNMNIKENRDEIFIIDIFTRNRFSLKISKLNLSIKNIKVSPNKNYIAFVGKSRGGQDIFIYDFNTNALINLTCNSADIEIKDFDWKADSTKVYFSSNESMYYNIYSVGVCSGFKEQISNTDATKIKISYKSKII